MTQRERERERCRLGIMALLKEYREGDPSGVHRGSGDSWRCSGDMQQERAD